MATPDAELLARLARHRSIGSAPAEEHAWLVEHGTLTRYAAGQVVTPKGGQATALHIMLDGRVVIRVDRGAGAHKVIEWGPGDVGGALPYSRGASPPDDAVAEVPTEVFSVDRSHFPGLIRECPVVTTILVHAMVDRARLFRSSDHRDEKLLSLGKLAAGLAHELNNPASAALRGAKALPGALVEADEAARLLGAAGLTAEQLVAVDAVRDACLAADTRSVRSAIERADREDEFEAWLDAHGASDLCASPLAATGLTLEALDALAAAVQGEALDAALRWLAAGCQVRTLAADIESSAARISGLVGAVKGFTFMDHAAVAEPIDVRRGLNDTLIILAAKLRAKNVDVSLQAPDDLPRAVAVGVELNQIWSNLLDNAIDAVAPGGRIEVRAERAPGRVIVRIIDDGPGIPPDIVGRIFDPFFTTKGVGQGTGLGLDIVRRIVKQQDGLIEVESRPGRTEFRVSLPSE
jgi:signal transduction histidine kinase